MNSAGESSGLQSVAKRLIAASDVLASPPALFTPTPAAVRRTLEFFTAHIRNPNTRRACARAIGGFATWCGTHGLQDLASIGPVHVGAYVEQLQGRLSAPRSSSTWPRCACSSTGP